MLQHTYFSSLIHSGKHVVNQLWQTTKTMFDNNPAPLWEQAQDEPRYRAYEAFCAQLNGQQRLEKIISPYALYCHETTPSHIKEALKNQLQQRPQQTTTSQGCVTTETGTDKTGIYIGVGAAVGAAIIGAAVAVGIFARKRRATDKQLQQDLSGIELEAPEQTAESSLNPK